MPSLKALLLSLLLAALALFMVTVFAKKSKPVQDAHSYIMENPNCDEIKIHSDKNDIVVCFENFQEDPQEADTVYIPMARLIGERFPDEFPLRIKRIFPLPDKINYSIGISGNSINIIKEENSIWRDLKTGCKFPGPCPAMPLRGEVAVNSILPGKILKIEQDSFFSVTIYHGENIYSKISNMKNLSDYAQIGNVISQDSIIGFLPKKDTALTFLEITRNGKHETWEKFFRESRE
jgi:hypothetical protein